MAGSNLRKITNPGFLRSLEFGNLLRLLRKFDGYFKNIAHLFVGGETMPQVEVTPIEPEPVERATVARVRGMLLDANATEDELKAVVVAKGHYKEDACLNDYSDDFITRWIIPNWKKILEAISKNKEAK